MICKKGLMEDLTLSFVEGSVICFAIWIIIQCNGWSELKWNLKRYFTQKGKRSHKLLTLILKIVGNQTESRTGLDHGAWGE